MFDVVVEQVIENVGKPEVVAVDAGYKTPYIAKFLSDQDRKWYPMRKETIERVFADAKEKQGMRWTNPILI